VLQGEFEGHRSWISVQIFALPLSACTPPEASLKSFVDAHNAELFSMKARADEFRAEIEAMPIPQNQEERAAYNKKVDEYNALIAQLNALIKETKNLVITYNDQVHRFNACIDAR
jgi:peptidoglycan hydrolase CwlO-like protein